MMLISLAVVVIANWSSTLFTVATNPRPQVMSRLVPSNLIVRTITQSPDCNAVKVVPPDTVLEFAAGVTTNCKIEFQGFGLKDPESANAIFAGVSPGDVVWTGATFPETISASLWGDSDLSDKLAQAFAAAKGRQVTVKAFPGHFGKPWQIPGGLSLYLTQGNYTDSICLSDGIQFFLESNTTVYGDGKDATILHESSCAGRNTRMFAGSGFKDGPFAGYNEKVDLHDFAIEGNPAQVFYDNGPTTVQLGNCTDCHAIKMRLKDTHAYGIYIGGFHNLGFTAKDSSIEYCEFDHVIGQNSGALNGINIKIVHNKYFNLGKLAADPLSNAVDVEPNVEDEITENIIVCDNQIDGRGSKQYWNGIIVQTGGSKHGISGGEVCRNTILGRDLAPGSQGSLLNGIAVAGANNIKVYGNSVQGALQSGLYFNNSRGLDVQKNILTDVAPGGIVAVRVENVTNSKFINNVLTKISPGNDDRFVEMGTSGNNVYTGNKRGSVVLLHGSAETDHQ